MEYEITMQTSEVLSILYRGYSNLQSLPNDNYYACEIDAQTIDLVNMTEMKLSDFVSIDSELVKQIKQSSKIVSGAPDEWEKSQEDLTDIIQYENEKFIIKGLKEEWSYYTFCVTPQSLIISIAIPHSEGDYALIEIDKEL